jgi:hypothetical protein
MVANEVMTVACRYALCGALTLRVPPRTAEYPFGKVRTICVELIESWVSYNIRLLVSIYDLQASAEQSAIISA